MVVPTYWNPISETTMYFRVAEPARLVIEWHVYPGHRLIAAPHVHVGDSSTSFETFEVLQGDASMWIGSRRERASAPHTFTVPNNTVHTHPANVGRIRLIVRQSILLPAPAPEVIKGARQYFETIVALSHRGGVTRGGFVKNPLQAALSINDLLLGTTYLAGLPKGAQTWLLGSLATVARRLGYQAYIPATPLNNFKAGNL